MPNFYRSSVLGGDDPEKNLVLYHIQFIFLNTDWIFGIIYLPKLNLILPISKNLTVTLGLLF